MRTPLLIAALILVLLGIVTFGVGIFTGFTGLKVLLIIVFIVLGVVTFVTTFAGGTRHG